MLAAYNRSHGVFGKALYEKDAEKLQSMREIYEKDPQGATKQLVHVLNIFSRIQEDTEELTARAEILLDVQKAWNQPVLQWEGEVDSFLGFDVMRYFESKKGNAEILLKLLPKEKEVSFSTENNLSGAIALVETCPEPFQKGLWKFHPSNMSFLNKLMQMEHWNQTLQTVSECCQLDQIVMVKNKLLTETIQKAICRMKEPIGQKQLDVLCKKISALPELSKQEMEEIENLLKERYQNGECSDAFYIRLKKEMRKLCKCL
ncbi:MAG: hypothetical protein ACI4HI_10020 [Lachnospiraceae bacterium]